MKTLTQPTRMQKVTALKLAAESASQQAAEYKVRGMAKVAAQYTQRAAELRADALVIEVELYEKFGVTV